LLRRSRSRFKQLLSVFGAGQGRVRSHPTIRKLLPVMRGVTVVVTSVQSGIFGG
jgi:hypothetical protein